MNSTDRFLLAKKAINDAHSRYNIGTYKEKSQHLFLKHFYEPDASYHEVPFEGYIADILNDEGITEIQTAGFRALHDKLTVFLPLHRVTVVYPVQSKAKVIWTDTETGESAEGRLISYPKAQYRLFSELLSICDYLKDEKLSIHVVCMSVTNRKALDGYGADRKKKATKLDSVPEEILDIQVLESFEDIKAFFPFNSGERITASDISKKLGLKRMALWRAIKFLTASEIIKATDKKRNAVVYSVN